ncbi:vanadium-dependent haloperoxidase [Pontibacter sp. G13]|uniref:vanadium-dependent haloperoxidase n=1 Tax=Pontibacter sp. G13 TaxID=3074898 RepID=UPI00288A9564|nr:vanadium-dependent haloperoxidase [Pontibacter sp. G13]WNJ19654.1 vanadium-dependent haloperoxidase [Pontibacter sp. G13]
MNHWNWLKGCGIWVLVLLMAGCEVHDPALYRDQAYNSELYRKSAKAITDIIVYDIFSPPVASRIYAYTHAAGYEVMRQAQPGYRSLAGQVGGLDAVPQADSNQEICFPLASIEAMLTAAETKVFSMDQLEDYRKEIHQTYRDMGIPNSVMEASIAYGKLVGNHVTAWANTDNYNETRTYERFNVTEEEGRWQPTPPDYMDAIEPHWNKIRPFIIDSATQFVPVRPTEYSMDKSSLFYEEMMEVYEVSVSMNEDQKEIAEFWDCNPFVTHHQGHVMFATKKITPGGHWIGIVDLTTRKAQTNFMETVDAFTRTSITLADAFISCWDEKYRSNLIRPETVINKFVDEDWRPLLQTPPFPEYTSGHSVVSGAAATTLTAFFGDNFAFADSSELEFGLPVRNYNSFLHAAEEAAISRLYGGIHYMPAIKNGVDQGKKVGAFIRTHLVTKEETATASR